MSNAGLPSPPPQPQSPPRHWHGSLGDRYEHHNVWVRGGIPQAYYPRSSSESGSSSMTMNSNSSNTNTTPRNNAPSIDRRRSSNPALFSGLSTQKRNPMDTSMTARRQSWKDQEQPGGWFSKWWDGFTKGS